MVPKPTCDLFSQKYKKRIDQGPPDRRQRLALATFEMDLDWDMLYLDSKHARFKYPSSLPAGVHDIYQREIEINHLQGVTDKFFKRVITVHVIHSPGSQDQNYPKAEGLRRVIS